MRPSKRCKVWTKNKLSLPQYQHDLAYHAHLRQTKLRHWRNEHRSCINVNAWLWSRSVRQNPRNEIKLYFLLAPDRCGLWLRQFRSTLPPKLRFYAYGYIRFETIKIEVYFQLSETVHVISAGLQYRNFCFGLSILRLSLHNQINRGFSAEEIGLQHSRQALVPGLSL